jgi:hypothetical protein
MNNDIIKTIVSCMEQVELRSIRGSEKKRVVLEMVALIIGHDAYERYAYFIAIFIDYVIDISKGNVELNINQIKYCCF